jgi:hypothetical protein
MRFLLIVLLAFLLVRLVTSCDNNGQTKTAHAAKSPKETLDKRR